MWRFGEQFDLPTHPRVRGFICLCAMLLSDGIPYKKAQQRIAHLNEVSLTTDGKDVLAITAGYNATEGDGSLAIVLDYLNTLPQAAGAPSRLWTQGKPIAGILASAAFAVSMLLGYGFFPAIGIGIVIGITALGVTKIISNNMIKPKS
jgi:hypothetical protein